MRRNEQLSALTDNALAKDELRFLLKGLETDAEGRQTWARYQQIGDALRGESEAALKVDLASRVMAEIDANPAQDSVHEPAWMKRVVQFAVAASVATVAVFVANDRGLIGATAPSASNAQTASVLATPSARESSVAEWQALSPESQQQLDTILAKPEPAAAEPSEATPVQLVGHKQYADDAQSEELNQSQEQSEAELAPAE